MYFNCFSAHAVLKSQQLNYDLTFLRLCLSTHSAWLRLRKDRGLSFNTEKITHLMFLLYWQLTETTVCP